MFESEEELHKHRSHYEIEESSQINSYIALNQFSEKNSFKVF